MRAALLLLALALPAPALEVRVSPAPARPGDIVVVTVTGASRPSEASLSYRGRDYPLFGDGTGGLRALIGLTAEASPGTDPVRVREPRLLRADAEAQAPLTVEARAWRLRRLRMPRRRAGLTAGPGARDAVARIRAVAAVDSGRALWRGLFVLPALGRVSAVYGNPRTVNGRPWAWHKGVDVAAPEGTEVRAPNSGVVALSGVYPVQGGTVVIDHGQGLMSALFHLGEPLVKAGDEVAASSPVARVGGAGFSTGAHVHWGVYVHGAAVDPMPLLERPL